MTYRQFFVKISFDRGKIMNQKIKFVREQLKLSEKNIAIYLNISTYKYASYEKKRVNVPCDIILMLSKLYGINPEILIYTKYNDADILSALCQNQMLDKSKKEIEEKLRFYFFDGNPISISYKSVRKVKEGIQQNIINYILFMLKQKGLQKEELAKLINTNIQSINSILLKKRFITINELICLGQKFHISINAIINCQEQN